MRLATFTHAGLTRAGVVRPFSFDIVIL